VEHRAEATQGAVFAHLTKVCVCDISTSIDKSAATSSHHLTLLCTTGPVASEKRAHGLRKRIRIRTGAWLGYVRDPSRFGMWGPSSLALRVRLFGMIDAARPRSPLPPSRVERGHASHTPTPGISCRACR
jgi:DNA-binding transcriptional ArsR family regulator